jgi:hypothetical protein
VSFMVNNSTSVKAFWLSFLISGVAVPLGAIAATAQIQDTSTPEVALEGSVVPEANPDSALAAVKIEIPQLAAITAETNSAVDRPEPETDAAWVNRALPDTDAAVDRALPQTDIATVDRELYPKQMQQQSIVPFTRNRCSMGRIALYLETDTATVDRTLPKQDKATVDRAFKI